MPKNQLKILGVHGVGKHPVGGEWEKEWKTAIEDSLKIVDSELSVSVEFAHYDDIFEKYPITLQGTLEAVAKLVSSGTEHAFRKHRGLSGSLRWTAGMVVQWVENERLRRDTRRCLAKRIDEYKPDVICGHSLGSLVCYDSFLQDPLLINKRVFISLGSQIGNSFVVGNFSASRILPLTKAKYWYHLFNDEDAVFTARIELYENNFQQVDTPFDIGGIADHDAKEYLSNENTIKDVWANIVLERKQPELFKPARAAKMPRWTAKPKRRALLVGINEYPDKNMCLEGCVNDVFLMSALLQEHGFEAEDIRVVLDSRATAKGILERIEWLLDGVKDDDTRVLFYSGHGAQMPNYGIGDTVDRMDESLVPYDFDWSDDRAITDDKLYKIYSQLPYTMKFMVFFDCCHSGGMTRDGSAKIRGINPPDDIRHRHLRWNMASEMWVDREMDNPNKSMAIHFNKELSSATHKIGQAMALRQLPKAGFDKKKKELKHYGPYMPLLIYACKEDQFSYEYKHGTISYGAFTYCFDKTLRRLRSKGKLPTYTEIITSVRKTLKDLNYDQEPQLVGPTKYKKAQIPISLY